jgi:hypothetical protein
MSIKNSKNYFFMISVFNSNNKNKIKIGRLNIYGIDIAFGEESTSRLQCT